MNVSEAAYAPDIPYGKKAYVATDGPTLSPEQRSGKVGDRKHCACGYRVRGPNHEQGAHHRGNRNGKR